MPTLAPSEPPFHHMRQPSKLMDQIQKGFYVYSNQTWTPNVNLYETAATYLVCVDLAGVDKQKIDVEVADQRLRLRGTRAVPDYPGPDGEDGDAPQPEPSDTPQRVRVHLMEIDHGAFSREVELPADANREQISATYRNGMLWIEIPKA